MEIRPQYPKFLEFFENYQSLRITLSIRFQRALNDFPILLQTQIMPVMGKCPLDPLFEPTVQMHELYFTDNSGYLQYKLPIRTILKVNLVFLILHLNQTMIAKVQIECEFQDDYWGI